MKIAIKQDGRFAHWILDEKDIPGLITIDIDKSKAMELSQNNESKMFKSDTGLVVDFLPVFDLESAKTLTRLKIEKSKKQAKIEPVSSDALGVAHVYNSSRNDRQDLNDQITLSLGGYLTCEDGLQVKARKAHTHEQLLLVAQSILENIQSVHDVYQVKLSAINAATSQADLDSISWS